MPARLREAGARRRRAWLQDLVGTTQRVLFEKGGLGHAENFAPVRLTSARHSSESWNSDHGNARHVRRLDASLRWHDVRDVTITGVEDDVLIGDAA